MFEAWGRAVYRWRPLRGLYARYGFAEEADGPRHAPQAVPAPAGAEG